MRVFLSRTDHLENPSHLYYWNDKTGKVTEEYEWPGGGKVNLPRAMTLGRASTEQEAKNLIKRILSKETQYWIPPSPIDLMKMLRSRLSRGIIPGGKLTRKGPAEMYHTTLKSYLPSIIKEGLIPNKQPTFFREQTSPAPVLWLSETRDNVYQYLNTLEDVDNLPSREFVILQVEVPAYATLFKDPFGDEEVMEDSWVTYDGIPPQGIKVVGYATFKEGYDPQGNYIVNWYR